MNQIINSLLYLSLLLLFASCQGDVYDRRLEINDLPSVKSQQLVLLVDIDDFVVLATTKSVNKILSKWVRDYDLEEDKNLLKIIARYDNEQPVVIHTDSIAKINKLQWRIERVAGDLMQSNKCLIYNKRSMQLESLVKVENYTGHSTWGRRFYVKRKLLLDVMDGIE